jgi:2-polyprenyl-3-methyl-5-hydroxy-6-metoxy-1,4-benzoquinol methylase
MRRSGWTRDLGEAVRGVLRRSAPLRSGWYLGLAVKALLRDRWRDPALYDREFARAEDPWGYEREEERQRHRAALDLIERAPGAHRPARALEVGCAEGVFTELLARRCAELQAVDFAPLALERTAARCADHPQVRVARVDLRRDPLGGSYDLIVAMDVLSSIHRPGVLRRVRDRLVDSLEPGGMLLVGDVRLNEVWETACWSRYFVRGGKWITHCVAEHPQLEEVHRATLESHVLALFRKREPRSEPASPPDHPERVRAR